MNIKTNSMLAAALLLTAATGLVAGDSGARMVVVENKDVSGTVFKRLGLPNRDYCWEQCMNEARCTGARWGAIEGVTPGQCQLMSGELTLGALPKLKTEDGKKITVTVGRKETPPSKEKL
jgi:hypothetical protein